jgi:putative copper export protein
MQAITVLGLMLCLGVLFQRAFKARKQPSRSLSKRFGTARLLLGALLAWLVISLHLQHLNRAMGGEPQASRSTWERVIDALSDWL